MIPFDAHFQSQRFGLLRRQVRDCEVHLPVIGKSQRFGLLRPAQDLPQRKEKKQKKAGGACLVR